MQKCLFAFFYRIVFWISITSKILLDKWVRKKFNSMQLHCKYLSIYNQFLMIFLFIFYQTSVSITTPYNSKLLLVELKIQYLGCNETKFKKYNLKWGFFFISMQGVPKNSWVLLSISIHSNKTINFYCVAKRYCYKWF